MDATARPSLLAEVGAAIAGRALPTLGADAAYVAAVRGENEALEVVRVTPFADRPVVLEMAADAPYPIAETVRTRRPLFIPSNEELCEHPGLARIKSDDHACATIPLVADDGTVLGAVNFGFEDPHDFTPDELELIELVGDRCARAMSSARSLDVELARHVGTGDASGD